MPGSRSTPNTYPPDEQLLKVGAKVRGNIRATADEIGVSPTGLRAYLQRTPGLWDEWERLRNPQTSTPTGSHVSSDDPKEWGDLRKLLKARGLDPDDWSIVGARVNEWAEHRQLRVDLKPSVEMILPARADGWRPPKVKARSKADGELVAFFGDHHAPHHDRELHERVVAWLREHKPHRGIILGDLLDLDQVSRHRHDPEWTSGVQETIDQGYAILRAYVEASPGTRWQLLSGNHEDRLRNAVIDNLRGLHGVRRAGDDSHPVLSVAHLLRLDELGVEYVRAGGTYEHDQIIVSENLAARHGWIARKGSGTSARATIEHLRHSIVIGHTHRQSQVFHTSHSIDGEPRTLVGVEAGTLANIRGGLGYAISPDWVQGFAVANVWPDGRFSVELATYVGGALFYRGERY
jgi:hypothetical protein